MEEMHLEDVIANTPLSERHNAYLTALETVRNRKMMELRRHLAKQPVDKMGGAWLDNLT